MNTKTMKIEILSAPASEIVKLHGKFDIESTEEFEQQVLRALEKKPNDIIIDMDQLRFIDSSGIGSLIKFLNQSKNQSVKLHLAQIRPEIMNVIKLAKLDMFFNILSPTEYQTKFGGSTRDDVDDLIDNL